MLSGLMMNVPLLVSSLIVHADRCHGDTEIVSRTATGERHCYTYRDAHKRARQLAQALGRLGVAPGDRIATLAWNGHRHFELYYGVAGMGAVIHTVNPRLFREQIAYIINHAEDRYVFFDPMFAPLVGELAPACAAVRGWIAMSDHAVTRAGPPVPCYEDLLATESGDYEWPVLDERAAAGLCYSSGTTGHPKGVLYTHRSTILHAYGASLTDVFGVSARDVILPVVPMFHVNAWGLPHMAPLNGAKVVFPGSALDGKSLYELFEAEQVTLSAGVPTVWLGLLTYMKEHRLRFSSLGRVIVGGSTAPPALMRMFKDEFGVDCIHAWGMTEMSPLGTFSVLKRKHFAMAREEQFKIECKQGRAIYGVDMEIVDDAGKPLPHDGKAFGELMVRGSWVTMGYFKDERATPLRNGWFPTGDVATIDPDGYMQITDRAKDVIKSGGEWVSSIELENIALEHPAIAEAAVIGVRHPKWDERPLLVAVKKEGATITREALLEFYGDKVPKWMIPDDVVFVGELPHTATGKISKVTLRRQLADHTLPNT